jgi:site-specific recombinase XerD
MKLSKVIHEYITLKQSMGMRFQSEARTLKSFSRAMGDIDIISVKPRSVLAYIAGTGPVTMFWHRKFEILRGLYLYAIGRRYVATSPLPTVVPKRPQPFVPYIYTIDEMRKLLEATKKLLTDWSRLQDITWYTILLTLYGTGIRIGEALSLTLADVDLDLKLLTIRDTKFYKTRLVPIGPKLTDKLCAYKNKRTRLLPCPLGKNSIFFANRNGKRVNHGWADQTFRKLRKYADIHREAGSRYQPRIHDIRHTFAVHRLVSWYRQGADVQRLLPKLSTYLGHVSIAATQRYLTMTPELLSEANQRFERYALSEVNHV